jgi:hypothetical protein
MLETVTLCPLAGAVTVFLHHEGLRAIERRAARATWTRLVLMGVVFGIFTLHGLEIGLYAGAYALGTDLLHLGRLVGDVDGTSLEMLYFSAETFTTVGFGDIVPEGPLRLLASFEPLNGLILLGWSTSFVYVEVQRYWALDTPSGAARAGWTRGSQAPLPASLR